MALKTFPNHLEKVVHITIFAFPLGIFMYVFSTLNNLNCTLDSGFPIFRYESQRTRNPSVVYLIPDRISKAVALLLSAIIRKTTNDDEHNEIHESSENYSTFSYRSMPDTFGDSISKV